MTTSGRLPVGTSLVDVPTPRSEAEAYGWCSALGALRIDLLATFVVVAEELSFTRAAERLFLSQSGTSRRIFMLEAAVGTSLIVRTTRAVALTPGGAAFFPHAVLMIGAAQSAAAAAREARLTVCR